MRLQQMPSAENSDAALLEAIVLVRECLSDGTLDASEILRIGVFAAQKVNSLRGLTGPEKKALVLALVRKAVEAAVPAEQHESVGYTTALQVLPTVLDIAVAAAHGKLALQRVVRQRVSLSCLFGCFSSLWSRKSKPSAIVEAIPAETLESANREVDPLPETSNESPLKEYPKESSPLASAVIAPLECRLPEVASEESPSSATVTASVPSLPSVPEESVV